jgi:hypothetical protein
MRLDKGWDRFVYQSLRDGIKRQRLNNPPCHNERQRFYRDSRRLISVWSTRYTTDEKSTREE